MSHGVSGEAEARGIGGCVHLGWWHPFFGRCRPGLDFRIRTHSTQDTFGSSNPSESTSTLQRTLSDPSCKSAKWRARTLSGVSASMWAAAIDLSTSSAASDLDAATDGQKATVRSPRVRGGSAGWASVGVKMLDARAVSDMHEICVGVKGWG